MVFTSKWTLVSVENGEAYHKAINTPEEHKIKLRAAYDQLKSNPGAYVEELTVDKPAGTIHRVVYINGEKKKDSGVLPLGTEVEHTAGDGRKVKAKVTLDSDEKVTIHEKGADFEATITLTLHGDELTVTQASGGVTAIEKYKRV